jgi:hypothetical protein
MLRAHALSMGALDSRAPTAQQVACVHCKAVLNRAPPVPAEPASRASWLDCNGLRGGPTQRGCGCAALAAGAVEPPVQAGVVCSEAGAPGAVWQICGPLWWGQQGAVARGAHPAHRSATHLTPSSLSRSRTGSVTSSFTNTHTASAPPARSTVCSVRRRSRCVSSNPYPELLLAFTKDSFS